MTGMRPTEMARLHYEQQRQHTAFCQLCHADYARLVPDGLQTVSDATGAKKGATAHFPVGADH